MTEGEGATKRYYKFSKVRGELFDTWNPFFVGKNAIMLAPPEEAEMRGEVLQGVRSSSKPVRLVPPDGSGGPDQTPMASLENLNSSLGWGGIVGSGPQVRRPSLLVCSGRSDNPVFYIFLPLFAVTLGANTLELGLVGGTSYAVYSFMPFVMGHISDRRGSRKFFIITSLVILCVVSLLYAASNDPVSLIVVRVFEGVGWAMLWPAMEAAIVEDSARDPEEFPRDFQLCLVCRGGPRPWSRDKLSVTAFPTELRFLASGAHISFQSS